MIKDLTEYIIQNGISDYASIAGLIIAVFGFYITIRNVIDSKTAAEATEKAVKKVRDDLSKIDTLAEISKAALAIEEIKRLQRNQQWVLLPERYTYLRQAIIAIKSNYPNLSQQQKVKLQTAVSDFGMIENEIEIFNSTQSQTQDFSKYNKTISAHLDYLHEILNEIRRKIGK